MWMNIYSHINKTIIYSGIQHILLIEVSIEKFTLHFDCSHNKTWHSKSKLWIFLIRIYNHKLIQYISYININVSWNFFHWLLNTNFVVKTLIYIIKSDIFKILKASKMFFFFFTEACAADKLKRKMVLMMHSLYPGGCQIELFLCNLREGGIK